MLKTTLLAALLSFSALGAQAQTLGEFLNKPEIPVTFMGVDFSNTRYYGDPMTVGPEEMKSLFTRIDELLVKEADKYDLAKALHRQKVNYAIGIAESVNQKIDPATILAPGEPAAASRLTPTVIAEMVGRYNYPEGSTGIGLVFLMEDIMKTHDRAGFWAALVDMKNKQVLATDYYSGLGAGFGFRNHWASSINSGIKEMKYRSYVAWKKKYASK